MDGDSEMKWTAHKRGGEIVALHVPPSSRGGYVDDSRDTQRGPEGGEERTYEGVDVTNWIGAVSVQPLAADQSFMPHMKAKEVLFHFLYGSLICSKRLQNDRPKC